MKVSIPVGSTATIFVPASAISNVTENGNPVEKEKTVTFVRMENGYAVLQVSSGSYQFES
jgi:alpha-L-rhamnosidase